MTSGHVIRLRVNMVRFAPGARNAWHAHARGQTLHVTEGIGLIQSRGGQITEIRPGDSIYTPPGELHWHGAAAVIWPSDHTGQPVKRSLLAYGH